MKQLCMCSKSKHICNCSVNNSSSMRSRTGVAQLCSKFQHICHCSVNKSSMLLCQYEVQVSHCRIAVQQSALLAPRVRPLSSFLTMHSGFYIYSYVYYLSKYIFIYFKIFSKTHIHNILCSKVPCWQTLAPTPDSGCWQKFWPGNMAGECHFFFLWIIL